MQIQNQPPPLTTTKILKSFFFFPILKSSPQINYLKKTFEHSPLSEVFFIFPEKGLIYVESLFKSTSHCHHHLVDEVKTEDDAWISSTRQLNFIFSHLPQPLLQCCTVCFKQMNTPGWLILTPHNIQCCCCLMEQF